MPLFDRFKSLFRGQSSTPQRRPLSSVIEYDVDPHEFWDVLGELGDGAFGKVEKVVSKENRNQLAAAKRIEIEDGENFEDFLVEIEILTQCQHENIVGLLACYFFDGKLSMMLEFCAGGAVDSIMIELEKPLTEPQIAYTTRNVCNALEYLHNNYVIHRDLKAGNILLTSDAAVKLADFGVSAKMKDRNERRDSFIGTPYWMAPEVMVCETFKDQPYGCLSDIWSLGITLIEMAQMDPPNYQVSPMRVVIKVQKSEPPTLKRPSRWSIYFNDFIAKCLVKNPNDRYSATDLLTHPFIKNAFDKRPIIQLLCEKNAEILQEEIIVDEESSTGGSIADSEDRCFEIESSRHPLQPQQHHLPQPQDNHYQQQLRSMAVDHDVAPIDERKDRRDSEIDQHRTPKASRSDVDGNRTMAGEENIDTNSLPHNDDHRRLASEEDEEGQYNPRSEDHSQQSRHSTPPPQQSKKKVVAPKPPTIEFSPREPPATERRKQKKYFGQSQDDVEFSGASAVDGFDNDINTNTHQQMQQQEYSRHISSPLAELLITDPTTTMTSNGISSEAVDHQRSNSTNVLSPSGQEAIEILDDLYNALEDDHSAGLSSEGRLTPPIKSAHSFEVVSGDWVMTAAHPGHTKDEASGVSTLTTSTAVSGAFSDEISNSLSFEQKMSELNTTLTATNSDSFVSATSTDKKYSGTSIPASPLTAQNFSIIDDGSRDQKTGFKQVSSESAESSNDLQQSKRTRSLSSSKVTPLQKSVNHVSESTQSSSSTPASLKHNSRISAGSYEPVRLRINADDESEMFLSNKSLHDAQHIPHGGVRKCSGNIQREQSDNRLNYDVEYLKEQRSRDDAAVFAKQSTSHVSKIADDFAKRKASYGDDQEFKKGFTGKQKQSSLYSSNPAMAHSEKFSGHNTQAEKASDAQNGRPLSMPLQNLVELAKKQRAESEEFAAKRSHSIQQQPPLQHVQFKKSQSVERYNSAKADTDNDTASLDAQNKFGQHRGDFGAYSDNYSCYSTDNAPPPEPPVDYDEPQEQNNASASTQATRYDRKATLKAAIQPQYRVQKSFHSLESAPAEGSSKSGLHTPPNRIASQSFGANVQSKETTGITSPRAAAKLLHGGVNPSSQTQMSRKSPQRATVTKKTRTYVVDGVEVTSTTLHVLGVKQDYELRKKEMHDLKRMQREEARQQQELNARAELLREQQERKFAFEKQAVHKNFESDIDTLSRLQKKKIEEMERAQEEEMRNLAKKIRLEQERDLRLFKERLKQEQKMLKQEVDLLSKSQRKEVYRCRKEFLDKSHYEREADFLIQLDRNQELHMCRTRENHREKMAEVEREFLKQKHALERSLESALWELEERQLSDKHNLIAQQFRDVFHLQRTHMLGRHHKELEHIRKINQINEENLLRALTADRKGMPKALRNESKTRSIMFKESLRINMPDEGTEKWAEKIHDFEEKEKLRIRMKMEEYDFKCKRKLAKLVADNQNLIKELEEIHNEKRNMLVDNERSKLAEYEGEYRQVIQEWKAGLSARKTALETKFSEELKTQERFYNIEGNIGTMTTSSSIDGGVGSNGGV